MQFVEISQHIIQGAVLEKERLVDWMTHDYKLIHLQLQFEMSHVDIAM